MTDIERKAAKALFPYFSKNPVVVDVGSNKGDWAEVLAANVEKIILFEPNTILRHYSQVRFRYLRNVQYMDSAVSNHIGQTEFHYFEDEHDGLSNIIGNKNWDYLFPKMDIVDTVTLDSFRWPYVDFLKLDAEGAEWMILDGARKMLSEKRIKFIQVECGDHIKTTGKTFDDIVDLLRKYGYSMFYFSEELRQFCRCVEGVPKNNAENYYFMSDHNFSENWNLDFIENTRGMKFDFVLEIGCFEGLTSRYICDNLLNKEGRMIAVDPLTDEYLPGHKDNAMFVGQYDRFTRNTKGYPVELIRKPFADAFEQMKHYRFGLIYVDGDHREDAVYQDAGMAFYLCLVGGYIIFDDYDGYDEGTKRGIDRWASEIPSNKMTVVKRGYQLVVQKHENLI